MGRPVRWGILGCGSIARQWAAAIPLVSGAELCAVGSRSLERAEAFALELGARRAHGTYLALAQDLEVDAVYVATPHPFHAQNVLLCLDHGKAVLCEKPFTLNAAEAKAVAARAKEKKLLVMEAMWTRFFPGMARVRELLADGAIGAVRFVTADFGFKARFDPHGRLFDPTLGGGALLDVGVYCVSLASMILGKPNEVMAVATRAPTGVDAASAYLLSHPGGQIAVLQAAVTVNTPTEATISGEAGSIRLHSPFFKPSRITVSRKGDVDSTEEFAFEGNGYQFEIAEFCACLSEGRLESTILPLRESVQVMETLDALREAMGVRYPGEPEP
jgi:predicted dehydrogenase